jgi:RNA polymerase sigma-70 factor, ECF subfamily
MMSALSDQAVPATSPSEADPARAEADLLAGLRAADTAAFAGMVDGWSPVMLRVARRYVRDRQAAEDVVQEAWLGVLAGLARFEGRSSVRGWAFAILINRAKSRRDRDARVLPSAVLTGTEPPGPTVDPARFHGPDCDHAGHWTSAGAPRPWGEPERTLLDREVTQLVEQALNGVPERQRLVLEMRDVEGMSAEETCAALHLSPENQRVLLHRGRAAVRSALESYHRG